MKDKRKPRGKVTSKPRASELEWIKCERRIQDGLRELAELIGRYQTTGKQAVRDKRRTV